jgi:hypothetical protein
MDHSQTHNTCTALFTVPFVGFTACESILPRKLQSVPMFATLDSHKTPQGFRSNVDASAVPIALLYESGASEQPT